MSSDHPAGSVCGECLEDDHLDGNVARSVLRPVLSELPSRDSVLFIATVVSG